jgi:hypothetical protein
MKKPSTDFTDYTDFQSVKSRNLWMVPLLFPSTFDIRYSIFCGSSGAWKSRRVQRKAAEKKPKAQSLCAASAPCAFPFRLCVIPSLGKPPSFSLLPSVQTL